MNKKQSIVAWVVVIIVVFICLNPATYGTAFDKRTDVAKTLFYIISVLIPGSLLIYTLRDKKK